mmetsp:Transcript_67236/g.161130  ORF Transcript_67236/g.161130 Transcript_67236/m.161130 type:complete len:101 (+) Transcript_67236:1265-1567(+)
MKGAEAAALEGAEAVVAAAAALVREGAVVAVVGAAALVKAEAVVAVVAAVVAAVAAALAAVAALSQEMLVRQSAGRHCCLAAGTIPRSSSGVTAVPGKRR